MSFVVQCLIRAFAHLERREQTRFDQIVFHIARHSCWNSDRGFILEFSRVLRKMADNF